MGGFAGYRALDPDGIRRAGRGAGESDGVPVLCDADTGFGEAINVERTIRLYEDAGVAGLHLEDQLMPKRCGHLSGKVLCGFIDDGEQGPGGRAGHVAMQTS